MIPLSLRRIAVIVGGRLSDVQDPGTLVTAPTAVDSRDVRRGGLFAALVGDRADGHDYAARAIEAGAVAVLASRPVGVPAVVVADVAEALASLATHVLQRFEKPVVIGVTGSSGKTSTKDLLASVMPVLGLTTVNERSMNNELGLPLTVLRAVEDTRYLVLEMGARRIGDIAWLTRIAAPRVGVVTNVGSAHIGVFGSREAIASAKGELVEALPRDGLAVLNADDPLAAEMATRTSARIMTFGEGATADVRAQDVALDEHARASFVLAFRGATAPVSLPLHGRHHISNALAAASVALGLGAELAPVAAALSQAAPGSPGRMQVRDRSDGLRIVDDTFNANPDSVHAALQALASMAGGRRMVAVLGEMRELGDHAVPGHQKVGRAVADNGVDVLVAIGTEHADVVVRETLRHAPRTRILRGKNGEEALALLQEELGPGDIALFKAAHVAGFGEVVGRVLSG
ncbi:UDP-N-acetylmuramoyl-tripeptide--D-alanyl-D-alanine ligase [Streptomyces sp. NPDC004667]|uniref:UDP-N-acetylmuramoyl-tripeptide--D-alanyl-D- alanine ligase n=1 Tax=Streptomyces sp. NPDC004667 TaxID=3154285 RepID=UPI0033A87FE2